MSTEICDAAVLSKKLAKYFLEERHFSLLKTEPGYVFSMSFAYRLACLAEVRELAANKIAEIELSSSSHIPEFAIDDVHLASSCLQKALRRGDRDFPTVALRFRFRGLDSLIHAHYEDQFHQRY